MFKIKKAQSIVEYLLVFAGVVLAIIWGANQLGKESKGQMDKAGQALNKTNTTLANKLCGPGGCN